MASKLTKYSLALCAGLITASFSTATSAIADEVATPPAGSQIAAVTDVPFQIHETMRDDMGPYARGLFLAYIRSPNDGLNRLALHGLVTLSTEAHARTSVEPDGVVGIDIENDDISLFPFIYWPVSDETPPLSAEARARLQDYTGRGNLIVVDLIDGATLASSPALRGLLSDMQVRPLEAVEEGHVLTQSFYIVNDLPGAANRDVYVERAPERIREADMTSFVIGNQNWASAWSGTTVGPDVAEDGRRSGLNMLFAALTGNYKLDELHILTIEEKREFQEQNEERERQLDVFASATPEGPQP